MKGPNHMRNIFSILAAVALFGLFGATPNAEATELTVTNVTLPYSETVNLVGTIDGTPVNDTNQLAGQIDISFSDGTMVPVFCIDAFHTIYLGSSGEVYTTGPLTTDNSDDPSLLSATQINTITAVAAYGQAMMLADPSNLLSGEVQSAIWQTEYTNGALGNELLVTSTAFTEGDLTSLINAALTDYHGSAVQLVSLSGTQAEVFVHVDEPRAVWLLWALLLGLLVAHRARRAVS